MVSGEKAYAYHDPKRLMNWAVGGLVAALAADTMNVVLLFNQYLLLVRMQAGAFSTREEMIAAANRNDSFVNMGTGFASPIIIIASIIALVWVYRASANCYALGARDLYVTPGLAVGSYFIPFFCLWAPPITMNQVWKASQDAPNWVQQKGTRVVIIWWLLTILSGIGGMLTIFVSPEGMAISALQNYSMLMAGKCAMIAGVHSTLLFLVRTISQRQIRQNMLRTSVNVF